MELSKHHMSCGVTKHSRGEVHCICPGREAKIHAAAVRGCVGTGDGCGRWRPYPDTGCVCDWPECIEQTRAGTTFAFIRYLYRLIDSALALDQRVDGPTGWHITPIGPESERCTADEALPEVRRE
jgi:hypothetical protein